jgi:hypothetical protein
MAENGGDPSGHLRGRRGHPARTLAGLLRCGSFRVRAVTHCQVFCLVLSGYWPIMGGADVAGRTRS